MTGCVTDVIVKTTPPGADIYCNSELIGKSPCKVPMPEKSPDGLIGMNVIEARMSGYLPEYFYLSGTADTMTKLPPVHLFMTKAQGDIEIPGVASTSNSLSPSVKGPFLGLVCSEARIYRVSDMRCVGQASTYLEASTPETVGEILATELAIYLQNEKDAAVRVCTIRNRRMSTFGDLFAETLTSNLMRELCFCGGVPDIDTIDLSKWYALKDFDAESTIKDMKQKGRLYMIDYVVLGGIAEHINP